MVVRPRAPAAVRERAAAPASLSLPDGARPRGPAHREPEGRARGVPGGTRAAWGGPRGSTRALRQAEARAHHTCPPPLRAASLAARAERARLNLPFIPGGRACARRRPGTPAPRAPGAAVTRTSPPNPDPLRRVPEGLGRARLRSSSGGSQGRGLSLPSPVARPVGPTEHARWRRHARSPAQPRTWCTGNKDARWPQPGSSGRLRRGGGEHVLTVQFGAVRRKVHLNPVSTQLARTGVGLGAGSQDPDRPCLGPPCVSSILGMHLFGCKFASERDGDTLPDRKNFDSLNKIHQLFK